MWTLCNHKQTVRSALLLAVVGVPLPAMAASRAYIGPDGGSWSTPANWLGGIVPVDGDGVYIYPSGAGKMVIFDGNYSSPGGLGVLSVDESGFGTSAITQSANGMVVNQEQIGYTGRGRYVQTGGTNSAQSLFLGGLAGASGTYQLDGGTLTVSSYLTVGSSGSGAFYQSGGTVNVSSFGLTLGASAGASGSYYLSNGNVNANTINLGNFGAYGNIQQTGGAVAVTDGINNGPQGTYSFSGGNLSTPFFSNSGNFAVAGGSFSGGGINNNYLSISSGTFTNSSGFTNYGILTLSGGTFNNNAVTNNSGQLQINGNVTINGTGQFINDTQIIQNNGTINYNSTGQFTNNGNMQLAAGWSVNFNGLNAVNNGTINLNGGRVAGTAFLVNRPGATITGSGLITSLNNQGGRLLLTSGTTRILVPPSNSGIIELDDAAASLSGGAITNTGQIVGHGSIGNDITNSGTIEANGGNLILSGVVTNAAIGSFGCPESGKIIVIGGMSGNAGLINLSGGTFDNNSFPISNTGQISGFGTFRSGGLTNNGSITFTGGFTTVNGNVVNAATKKIVVAYNPALFTGNVTNNGIFKTTSTTATFSGAYTENGTFISDPSDNYFFDVFLNAPGSWTGGVGDRFFVKGALDWSGGSMSGSGAVTFNQGSATLHDANEKTLSGWTFNNEKPLTMSGGNINMGNGAVINNTDAFNLQSDAGIVNTLGGSATFSNSGAGVLRKTGGAGASGISALVSNNGGTIDVQTGAIALNGGLNIAAGTTLPKLGAGTLSIAGPQSHGAGAQLTDTAGRINLNSNAGTPATGGAAAVANLTLNVSGSGVSVVLGGNQDLKALNVPFASAGNQSFDLSAPAAPGAFNAVRIYATDLAAAKTTLYSAMKNANAAGAPSPTDGIYDSGRAAHPGSGVAIARINDAHGDSHIQIRLAKIGDLNLDNQVSISDFIDLASNFNSSGPNITWQEGDLNYDGAVTISDFIDLASNFNSTYSGTADVHPVLGGDLELLAAFASSIGVDPAVIGSAVPEPGTLAGLSAAALMLGVRRRKRSR